MHWGPDPTANWRWAFILVLCLAAASFVVSLLLAENSSAPEGRSLDLPGQITTAIALFGLLFAIIQASTVGWGSAQAIVGFGGKPFNPSHFVAFHALDHAYRIGFFVCAGAALLSFVLAGVALGGIRHSGEEPAVGV